MAIFNDFLTDEDLGILVSFNNHNLLKPNRITIDIVPDWAFNNDRICVRCEQCKCFMEFESDDPIHLVGKFKCPECGISVTEKRVYQKVQDSDVYDSDNIVVDFL